MNGFALNGANAGDTAGSAVSDAGDVNRDGIGDLIVGAPKADPGGAESGAAFVVFGKNHAWTASLSLASLNGSNGLRLDGSAAGDAAGFAVAGSGDINFDSFDDLLVGARLADTGAVDAGKVYLIFDASQTVNEDFIFANSFE
jgi:hypothetical protein